MLTIQRLDAQNVVSTKTELCIISVVERAHDGPRYAGVTQAKSVTNLVRGHLQ